MKARYMLPLMFGCLLVGYALAEEQAFTRYLGTALIQNEGLGLYWDLECTVPAPLLSYPDMEVGENRSIQLFIKNTSPVKIGYLTCYAEDWKAENPTYLQFTLPRPEPWTNITLLSFGWNFNGGVLEPGEVKAVEMTLRVSRYYWWAWMAGTFMWDIIIVGEQAV